MVVFIFGHFFLSICSSSPTTHPSRCRPLAVEMVSDPMPPPTTQMKQVGLFFAMVIHGKMESWKSHLVKVQMVWTNCSWWTNSCTWDHLVLKSMINQDAINLSSNIKWCKIARVSYTVKKHPYLGSIVETCQTYCWWTKSCTSKDDDYPIIYRGLTIPGGAGFCPSTVWRTQNNFQQAMCEKPERRKRSLSLPDAERIQQ